MRGEVQLNRMLVAYEGALGRDLLVTLIFIPMKDDVCGQPATLIYDGTVAGYPSAHRQARDRAVDRSDDSAGESAAARLFYAERLRPE